jgi:aspartate kinase
MCKKHTQEWRIIMRKVVKFGGSSLASAEQFKKVGAIIRADKERKFVVPSAPGKRFSGDTKVTDMLYGCYDLAEAGQDFKKELQAIKDRYQEIIDGLAIKLSLDEEFKKIEKNFKEKAGTNYAASRGEYLNGIIMANYLGFTFIDAAEVIEFNEDGEFNAEVTNQKLRKRLDGVEAAVIPGFYGAYADGTVKTFSRGGSDITGSIVARAIKANVYENWTDVSGFLVADPRIIDKPEGIETITYRELRELAYMGASVLHEDAIFPVRSEGIPINIRNTNAPEDNGTWIVESTCQKSKYVITGIAGKKGFCAVNIEKDMMNSEIGFGRKVLQAFEENGISFEHVPSGIDTMTVFVHQDEFMHKEQQVVSAIHRLAEPDSIDIEADFALIAVVGRGMKSTRGTAGRIFSALAHANVNVKMIDQGSSELNIIIGVANEDFDTAIKAIYDIFVISQL